MVVGGVCRDCPMGQVKIKGTCTGLFSITIGVSICTSSTLVVVCCFFLNKNASSVCYVVVRHKYSDNFSKL